MGNFFSVLHSSMDSAPPPPQPAPSRPTHIPLPPPPSFPTFLATPSPSQRDDPFAEDIQSPYCQFFTAPSTPSADLDSSEPPSPAAVDYFTPPTSPFFEIPQSISSVLTPIPSAAQEDDQQEQPAASSQLTVPLVTPHSASTYVSPSPYGTDDIYPEISVDIVNDLILDDGSLTALEKIYLFCRSKQVIHRSFITRNMPKLLQEVQPQEAVEYVLPLFRELALDPDETVQEEFSRTLGDVMWWFLTHCQVIPGTDQDEEQDVDNQNRDAPALAQIHYQTFTPLFGSLILSSNGNVSETARNSIATVLERIKIADDKDTVARGDNVRPPLPPENLWKAPAPDYAMDDPEIEEELPDVGLFGPEERTRVKHEILAALVVSLGRLDWLWQDGGPEETPAETSGQNVDERWLWLQTQTGDGVQVVSPDRLGNDENGVTTSTVLEASSSNVIIKEDTVNPFFPIVPDSFSTPSSTSSTPSTSNSAHSSSGSSPMVPPAGVSSSSPVHSSPSSAEGPTTPPQFHTRSSPSPESDATAHLQAPSLSIQQHGSPSARLSPSAFQYAPSDLDQVPAFLQHRRTCRPKGPLAYQLNLGNMVHEEQGNVFYDEQATNGRWSTMRLVASIAANGTADLESEVYFIKDVDRSVQDPVYWVRREAAFCIGALARVVPIENVLQNLVPMFERLVKDPHPDVRQNILFSLPPLAQRLPPELRVKVTFETLTALAEDPEITVRESALDSLSETIYAFIDDPQGPPEFLLHMYLGRKEDKIVRNGTRLITFDIPPPLEAFYLDTKRPLTLAFGFPAVTLTLGKERWGELREAYLDLAANRMDNVKRALAAGLGAIAKIVGPEITRQDLVQVWWNSINHPKDSSTRIRAIENMETLISVVGKELGLSFWDGVVKNWEKKVFRMWRERKIILQEVFKMLEPLGEEILPVIKAIEAMALVDVESGVRDLAVEYLPKVLGLLSPRQELLNSLNGAVTDLLSSTFRRRMTFASCLRSIFLASVDAGKKPSMALTDEMLRVAFDLSQDTVTDVRISVARFVGGVCDKFVRESERVPDLLAEIVQRLSQDSSLSVKTFIPDPATLLGGQSYTFPSSDEVVEPEPGLPNRSRHFSKPPLPRQNSAASGLSGADNISAVIEPLEATPISGTAMVVDRSYGAANILAGNLELMA